MRRDPLRRHHHLMVVVVVQPHVPVICVDEGVAPHVGAAAEEAEKVTRRSMASRTSVSMTSSRHRIRQKRKLHCEVNGWSTAVQEGAAIESSILTIARGCLTLVGVHPSIF